MTPGAPQAIVLVVGPDPAQIGGIAGVTGQMLALDFAGRFRLHYHATTSSPVEKEPLSRRCVRHLRQLRLLRDAIIETGADVVHIHTCSGFSFYRSALDAAAARRLRRGVVLHIHGAAFDRFCRQAGPLQRRLIRRTLQSTDRVIALSSGWRRAIEQVAPAAKLVTIENAVRASTTVRSAREAGPCRFLLLARMDEWKGVDDLLNACATLQGTGVAFEVTLAGPAGSAGDASVLTGKIRDRELQSMAKYIGPVRGEAKDRLLARADVCVQPSHQEGLPLAVLEAMAHGLPVIGTCVGALPEVIRDGENGLLVPPGRPDRLADAMRQLAGDSAARTRLGQRGRYLVETRFSLDRFRDDLAALYHELVAEKRQPGTARRRRAGRPRERLAADAHAHQACVGTA